MPPQRSAAIDAYRGLAILGMVLANYLAGIRWIPAWLKHAPDVGFTVIDLVAPMFIFAIGLTFGLSARRRAGRDGPWKMIEHFIARFFAILGIGALLGAGEVLLQVDGQTTNWGVLQAIGVAGLATLVLIRTPTILRLGAGLAILAVYQFLLQRFWLQTVLASPHGGLYGSLDWAAMLILATVLADLYWENRDGPRGLRGLSAGSALALLLGLGLALWFPVSKNRVSASYVLVSLGASGLVFAAVQVLVMRLRWRPSLLAAWGENPLVLYVLHLLLLGFVAIPEIPGWYHEAPPWLVSLQAAGLLALLGLAAWQLDRRKNVISL